MSAEQRSRNNVFAGLELDRCTERRPDQLWIEQASSSSGARFLVLDSNGNAMATSDAACLQWIDLDGRTKLLGDASSSLLGVDNQGVPYFLLTARTDEVADVVKSCNGKLIDLRRAGVGFSAFEAGMFAYARGLAHWQARTCWCGACGHSATLEWGGHRARCSNPDCAIEHYPRTDPAIIVIVTWRDACLLGRQASWPAGRFSTLAGFVEPGETLEDAVRREVFEEAGVRVVDSDYHSSQPWPFPSSLMLGFTARADDPAIKVGDELDEARWFEVDDFVRDVESGALGLPPPLSVSYRLVEHWLKQAGGLELSALKSPATWT